VVMDIVPRAPQLTAVPPGGYRLSIEADGARAFWIGTRRQAAQHAFRQSRATLEKLERLFAGEFGGVSMAVWNQAMEKARCGASAEGQAALELAEELQQLAVRLQPELSTPAPVDLAKLLFRLRAEISLVPVALLNLEGQAPRLVADAMRGATTAVRWRLSAVGDAKTRIVSPWDDVAEKSLLLPSPLAGDGAGVRGRALDVREVALWMPASPPRRLMPYLLEACGKVGGAPFTVATPVDLQVGAPLEVKLLPEGVLRGRQTKLTLSVANRCSQGGRLTITFRLPAKVQLDPAKLSIELDGRGRVERELTLSLDRNVPIGDLRLTYTVTSADPRFGAEGPLFLTVGDAP